MTHWLAIAFFTIVASTGWRVPHKQSGSFVPHRVPAATYWVFVASEGNDRIALVSFGPNGAKVERDRRVGLGDQMVEVTRIPTCIMPHGLRLNPQGTKQYSLCMMNDDLVEIDTRELNVVRHFRLAKGKEEGLAGAPMTGVQMAGEAMAGYEMSHDTEPPQRGDISCSPTWAQPSADGSKVYVACNKANDIVEIDVASWRMTRRIPTGDGVYNLAATHDGKLLLGTNKRGQSVSVVDIATGKELARIPTTRKVASGIAVSSDDRYAFATIEGVGSQPGTVDIIDLTTLQKVASVDVGQQAGGIDFWKKTP